MDTVLQARRRHRPPIGGAHAFDNVVDDLATFFICDQDPIGRLPGPEKRSAALKWLSARDEARVIGAVLDLLKHLNPEYAGGFAHSPLWYYLKGLARLYGVDKIKRLVYDYRWSSREKKSPLDFVEYTYTHLLHKGSGTEWDKAGHVGEYGWGGAASTHYWVSPKDDGLIVVTLEQIMPYNFDTEWLLKPVIYEAIVD